MHNGAGNVTRENLGSLKFRKSARNLTQEELTQLRDAYKKVMAIKDDRGYQHFAGIHGLPLPIYCQHNTPLFFPWHRAYIYHFEQALQDQVKGVTLPWWDWTSTASHQEGIPKAYAEPRVNGEPNPLYQARIEIANRSTNRVPDPPADLPSREWADSTLSKPNWNDFLIGAESVHGGIHVWVGGDMEDIAYAAYDPIFWAHHSMVDRLWWLWQLRYSKPGPPPELLDRPLPPFHMTVRDTLDIHALGYEYAAAEVFLEGGG